MILKDRIYGKVEINEPVLIELINSKPLQRIKKVNQAGTQLVEPHRTSTRYDHCVGVMLLLRKFKASIEEQIAGLLHDVPHTAFSHAVDFVFQERESQVYHERFLQKIVFESEIPVILKNTVSAQNLSPTTRILVCWNNQSQNSVPIGSTISYAI